MVRKVQEWTNVWIDGVSTSDSFDDPFKNTSREARNHILKHYQNQVARLGHIADREQAKVHRAQTGLSASAIPCSNISDEGLISALNITYDGPGVYAIHGRRHDNDFDDIQDIRVAPTHDELMCCKPPFLPANIHGAPHHLPAESMERLKDIQFRLLREELRYVLTMLPVPWLC